MLSFLEFIVRQIKPIKNTALHIIPILQENKFSHEIYVDVQSVLLIFIWVKEK